MFRPRAEFVGALADRFGLPPGAGLVDVGSGFGIFLEEVQRLGRFGEMRGVEPNPDLANVCRQRGFAVVPKSAEDVADGEVQADVATAFEVLEHVFDPGGFLTAMGRLVKPGGVLLFTTLTCSGFDIQVLWERSKSVHPPHHLNLISVEGIARLVERVGLCLVDLSTPGVLDVDIVANARSEDPTLHLPRFVSYLLSRRDSRLREALQRLLIEHALSSHVRVLARRPEPA